MDSLNTPVVLFIFNRPDVTRLVFAAIAKAKPSVLYIFADGPRTAAEKQLTDATRQMVAEVNWPCTVYREYSEVNLGCDPSIRRGLNQVFSNEETAIILEDDCLPDQSFFTFCHKLLDYYKNDPSIYHIGGYNFQYGNWRGDGDYYFSKYPHAWGWATWRRAWLCFDATIQEWPRIATSQQFRSIFNCSGERRYWEAQFKDLMTQKADYWDAQWVFSVWARNGKCVIPNKSLVKNIGFRDDATHTRSSNPKIESIPLESINDFKHPSEIKIDKEADTLTYYNNFHHRNNPINYMKRLIKNTLKRIIK